MKTNIKKIENELEKDLEELDELLNKEAKKEEKKVDKKIDKINSELSWIISKKWEEWYKYILKIEIWNEKKEIDISNKIDKCYADSIEKVKKILIKFWIYASIIIWTLFWAFQTNVYAIT